MSWEKFVHTGESFFPKVTIRANAQLGFSRATVKRFGLQQYKSCLLYFDKEGQRIGIRFEPENDIEGSVPTRIREFDYSVPAKAFLDYYGIPYENSKSFKATKDNDTGLIILDLRKPLKSATAEHRQE